MSFQGATLTEPCLTVSGHTARAIPGELPPPVVNSRFLPSPVDQVNHDPNGLPPSLHGITRFIATTEQSAPARCFGTFGLAGPPLAPFPLAPPNRFSSSVPEPRLESRHLYPGHRMASNQVSAMLFPEDMGRSGFDASCRILSRPLPVVCLRSVSGKRAASSNGGADPIHSAGIETRGRD